MSNQTLEYAKRELNKYAKLVFGREIEVNLSLAETVSKFDDSYTISVVQGRGSIVGSNAGSVLMGVYGLFYELGCRWIRPSKDGDYIVRREIAECNVQKTFVPKYRHRGICSEGVISEENLTDMIEWLPKMQMNTFFLQFTDGHLFFEKWYKRFNDGALKTEKYSARQSAEHYAAAVREIKRRGLRFHAVGHGWTTEPLGYVTYGDKRSTDDEIKEKDRGTFALVKGKRGFYVSPGDTQLCYSNPFAREIMTDGVVSYLKNYSEIDVLHFWLADNINNHCECENCVKNLPSDYYVEMLNELDEKLTKNGITTKIVFLIYCDLLFAPEETKINNPDRFIMTYAPIARDYFEGLYGDGFIETGAEKPRYVRNKNRHPKTKEEYLYYLKKWREVVQCDSFSFEYHLMIFQYGRELSSLQIARTIYDDMNNLYKVGLNGNVSCQLQRISAPTFLPNYVMAKCLAGTAQTFEEIREEYMLAAFGEKKDEITSFLERTKSFFCSAVIRRGGCSAERTLEIEEFSRFVAEFIKNTSFEIENNVTALSLRIIKYFAEILIKFLAALGKKSAGEDYAKEKTELFSFLDENESEYQKYLDVWFFKDCVDEFMGETEVVL